MPEAVERPNKGVHCQFNDAVSCKHNGVYLSLCLAREITESAEEICVVVYMSKNERKCSHWLCSFRYKKPRTALECTGGAGTFMRTVTPQRAGAISIQDLEEAVCQPVAVLLEENEVVQYLV